MAKDLRIDKAAVIGTVEFLQAVPLQNSSGLRSLLTASSTAELTTAMITPARSLLASV